MKGGRQSSTGSRLARPRPLELQSGSAGNPTIEVDSASIRFVEAKDGRGDGLGGIDVDCVDRDAVLAGAKQRGCGVNDEQVLLGGLRVYLRG